MPLHGSSALIIRCLIVGASCVLLLGCDGDPAAETTHNAPRGPAPLVTKPAEALITSTALRVKLAPSMKRLRVEATLTPGRAGPLTLVLSGLADEVSAEGAEITREGYVQTLRWSDVEANAPRVVSYRIIWPEAQQGIAATIGPQHGYLLPESLWFPQAPPPFMGPSTPYTLEVEAPKGITVLGAGTRSEKKTTTTLSHPAPGRPFFVYGRYQRFERAGFKLWALPETPNPERAATQLAAESASVWAYYEGLLGGLDRDMTRVISVHRRGGWGARHAALLGARELSMFALEGPLAREARWLLAHELAHTYWGGVVTPQPEAYGLLVEGSANYFAARYLAKDHPDDLPAKLAEWRHRALSDVAISSLMPGQPGYSEVAYHRGAWIHWMLARWLGDDVYHGSLRALVETEARPSLETLRARLEADSGASLNAFFREWIQGTAEARFEVEESVKGVMIRNTGTASTPPLGVVVGQSRSALSIPPGGQVERPAPPGVPVLLNPEHAILTQRDAVRVADRLVVMDMMQKIIAATRGGPHAMRGVFLRSTPALQALIGVADRLTITDWYIESSENEGMTFQARVIVRGTIGEQPVRGPLVLTRSIGWSLSDVQLQQVER